VTGLPNEIEVGGAGETRGHPTCRLEALWNFLNQPRCKAAILPSTSNTLNLGWLKIA